MIACKVLLGILLVLFLISLIRVGGAAEYSADGIFVWVRVGPIRVQVYPQKKEKKREEKPPEEKEKPKSKKGGPLPPIKKLLPVVCEAAGELKRRICIDKLVLDYISGGLNAAETAKNFGYSSAAAGMLLPLLEQNFNVKERRVRTGMDFTAKAPVIYTYAAFSARIGQLVSFAIRFGWKFLQLYWENKRNIKSKKEAI